MIICKYNRTSASESSYIWAVAGGFMELMGLQLLSEWVNISCVNGKEKVILGNQHEQRQSVGENVLTKCCKTAFQKKIGFKRGAKYTG